MRKKEDEYYMQLAFKQAQKAFGHDEVPVGAIVVTEDGIILGRGYNQVAKRGQQIAHAEVIAISKASKKIGDWRLDNCWLYVTLEPCKMCMGLVNLSRLKGIVFGAPSKLFGYRLDKEGQVSLYNKDVKIKEGIFAEESAALLKKFFKQKRLKKE
jgi:tRNA(adenine34) deaminase